MPTSPTCSGCVFGSLMLLVVVVPKFVLLPNNDVVVVGFVLVPPIFPNPPKILLVVPEVFVVLVLFSVDLLNREFEIILVDLFSPSKF